MIKLKKTVTSTPVINTEQAASTSKAAEVKSPALDDAGAPLGKKVQAGLIDAPASPDKIGHATAVDARQVGAPFDSFMKVRTFEVDIQRPGVEGVQTVTVHNINGPGHNCSMVAPLVLGSDGVPQLVVKEGDTRAARALRGMPYVRDGMIGGRWDKVGADPEKIGVGEIAEEIGATMLPGGFLPLGSTLVPTMPLESTEADAYFTSIVRIDGDDKASGDESGMEVVGLMKPGVRSIQEGLTAMDNGQVGEGARARVAYTRALDAIGFIPELGAYVHDLPGPVQKRFSTLGLGDAVDPRALPDAPPAPEKEDATPPAAHEKAAQVNDVTFVSQSDVEISGEAVMIDAKTAHMAGGEQVGEPFPNQIYHLNYDRAKVATFYNDPMQGPMVKMETVERPIMAAKGMAMDEERTYKDENVNLTAMDVANVKIPLGDATGDETLQVADKAVAEAIEGGTLSRLGGACDASPGQSDMRFHFFANKVAKPKTKADKQGFVKLSDAIKMCRAGEGDAGTEALLLRLAGQQNWVPTLDMSVSRAQKMIGS